MLTKLFNLTVVLLVVFSSMSFAQNGKWSIALKSSYFGDQSDESYRMTSIKDSFSKGFQVRYFPRPDFALQFVTENENGKIREKTGEELNVQTSLSALIYPTKVWKFSPYFIQGLIWVQSNRSNEAKSNSKLNFHSGIGTDIALLGNLICSTEAKIYSDGLNYLGWGPSFGLGYKF